MFRSGAGKTPASSPAAPSWSAVISISAEESCKVCFCDLSAILLEPQIAAVCEQPGSGEISSGDARPAGLTAREDGPSAAKLRARPRWLPEVLRLAGLWRRSPTEWGRLGVQIPPPRDPIACG